MDLTWNKGTFLYNYTNKVVRENIWKLQNLGYTKEDLSQELYIVYHKCREKYQNDGGTQFFNKFRKAVTNKINRLCILEKREKTLMETYKPIESYEIEKEIILKLKLESAPINIKNFILYALEHDVPIRKITQISKKDVIQEVKKYIEE